MAKLMGLLSKIGLVEEVQPGAAPAPVASNPNPVPIPVSVPAAPVKPTVSQDQARIAAADQVAKEQLELAIDNANANVAEEFLAAMGPLAKAIPDERVRYQTALQLTIAKSGSIPQLVGDFDSCLGALDDKSREFESQLKARFEQRVGAKVQQVKTLEEQISAKQQQYLSLQQEIQDLITRKGQEQSGITEEQAKLDLAQERFTIQYGAMRRMVEEQKGKIAQYGEGL